MKTRRLFSALSFAFVTLSFFGAGCASTEEEPSPERTEVKEDVVDGDDVGLDPKICYMCFRCTGPSNRLFCGWGLQGGMNCENNCAASCEHESTSLCSGG